MPKIKSSTSLLDVEDKSVENKDKSIDISTLESSKVNTIKQTEDFQQAKDVQQVEAIQRFKIVQQATNKFKRDSDNGLINSIDYVFNNDGSINWRAMIKKEYLVPNKERLSSDIDISSFDISSLDDSQLVILLAGIKDIAQIRGYKNVGYDVISASQEYVAVQCTIEWIGNYETNMENVWFSSLADCHMENTKSFARDFLLAIAENRAFVRAVRNFLKINIVGQDELGDKKEDKKNIVEKNNENSSLSPLKVLETIMKDTGLTFDLIKNQLIKEGDTQASTWNCLNDIPVIRIFGIIERIKNKRKTKTI